MYAFSYGSKFLRLLDKGIVCTALLGVELCSRPAARFQGRTSIGFEDTGRLF